MSQYNDDRYYRRLRWVVLIAAWLLILFVGVALNIAFVKWAVSL